MKEILGMDADYAVIDVTPEMAEKMLTVNFDRNRPINQVTVRRYALAMTEGRWLKNSDAIAVTSEGKMINGQHRLSAIILSGMTVPLAVMLEVDPKLAPVIDRGKSNTPGNALHKAGYDHANILAPMIQFILRYEESVQGKGNRKKMKLSGVKHFDEQVLIRRIEQDPSIMESAAFVDKEEIRKGVRCIANISQVAFLHYMGSKANRPLVEAFIISLATGEGLEAGSPILALRRRMYDAKALGRKIDEQTSLGLLVRAWRSYVSGDYVQRVQWTKSRSGFPTF